MKDLVNTILAQPEAKLIVDQVNECLAEEQKKRQEFYELIDEDTKAEFVNGEIYYHSPVKKEHNDAAGLLHNLLKVYVMKHQLGYVGYDKIMVSFTRNDYEPDLCFFNQEKAQHFQKGQMHFPAPDLAIEVLSSNEKHDREVKFHDYQEHGVPEYWIIDPAAETLEQYVLKEEKFKLKLKASEGHVQSIVVEGFRIPIPAVFNEQENLKALAYIMQNS